MPPKASRKRRDLGGSTSSAARPGMSDEVKGFDSAHAVILGPEGIHQFLEGKKTQEIKIA